MDFIITAGGTAERIDQVRSITNSSTGALGVKISEAIHNRFPNAGIYYVCGARAMVPDFYGVSIIRITDTADLQKVLTNLLTSRKISAVIHAMAVSDYRVRSVYTAQNLACTLAARLLHDFPAGLPDEITLSALIESEIECSASPVIDEKISSDLKSPLILLEKTPKVISLIRTLQPDTFLVGFKLLCCTSKNVLIDTAHALLKKNQCKHCQKQRHE